MQIKFYDEMELKVFDKTPIAKEIMQTACEVTMHQIDDIVPRKMSVNLANQLIISGHTSIFEHASITFMTVGISRSLLAQLTRQRHFSFTSASQHYQDYSDYAFIVDRDNFEINPDGFEYIFKQALTQYKILIEDGIAKEEARQVLPNASAVNLMITANPRALMTFLETRLCRRNVKEMRIFAGKLYEICLLWLPEIFVNVGEPCKFTKRCNQGKLSCGMYPSVSL